MEINPKMEIFSLSSYVLIKLSLRYVEVWYLVGI